MAGVLKTLAGPYPWLGTHVADLLSHLHLPAFDLPPPPPASMSPTFSPTRAPGPSPLVHTRSSTRTRCATSPDRPSPWLGTHVADLLSHLHLPAFDLPPPPPASMTDDAVSGRDNLQPFHQLARPVPPHSSTRAPVLARDAPQEGPTPVEGNAAAADDADDIVLPDGAGRRVDELLLSLASLSSSPGATISNLFTNSRARSLPTRPHALQYSQFTPPRI
jgi:hypothetical protein